MHRLICHPDTPAGAVSSVDVTMEQWRGGMLMLVYHVQGAERLKLPDHPGGPIDGLWQGTCFEMFARERSGSAYSEYNFAPIFGWAAYTFTDWRNGMAPLALGTPPHLFDCRIDDRSDLLPKSYELDVVIDTDAVPRSAMLGLSAVIEETDGTKSYWALRHPPGPPDFHHPDCFALELPALGSA